MNIILFEASEAGRPLPRSDPRARHVVEVLRCGPGDVFDAGLVDGPRGKATVVSVEQDVLRLEFRWGEEPPALSPITLIVGLPRPQTARKVLEEATALGVAAMRFVATERGEASYARSRLWTTGEWRRRLIDGAQQAFSTRLPLVTWEEPLTHALAAPGGPGCRLALDNYEAEGPLSQAAIEAPVVLALGPERGWSAKERRALAAADFRFVHLGERVLRLETAAVAAVAIVKARLRLM